MTDIFFMLILGFLILIIGANFFVSGSRDIAKLLNIPPVVIGLTVVAIGTSIPETSVGIVASILGYNDISVSSIIGSNIFNIFFTAGILCIIKTIYIDDILIKKDLPISMFATVLLLVFMLDCKVTRLEGIILLIGFLWYAYDLIKNANTERKKFVEIDDTLKGKNVSTLKALFFSAIGLIAVIYGADLVVINARKISDILSIPRTFIGLTAVAMGTSLPELVTSLVALKKGEPSIAIGNIIGSNIFNILFVLGASSVIGDLSVSEVSFKDVVILFTSTYLFYITILKNKSLKFKNGIICLVFFFFYIAYIIIR